MQLLIRPRTLILLAIIALLWPGRCFAEEQAQLHLSAQKIKAGLIYNFLKYTEWPGEATNPAPPLVVCIFGGGDPLSGYLQPIEERTVQQRPVKLHHISTVKESAACHMLFVGNDAKTQWPALHKFLSDKSVLTVGDFNGFSKKGGMIEFSTEENRIQIWLNLQAVSTAHLRIYDSLRRLAKVTRPSAEGAE